MSKVDLSKNPLYKSAMNHHSWAVSPVQLLLCNSLEDVEYAVRSTASRAGTTIEHRTWRPFRRESVENSWFSITLPEAGVWERWPKLKRVVAMARSTTTMLQETGFESTPVGRWVLEMQRTHLEIAILVMFAADKITPTWLRERADSIAQPRGHSGALYSSTLDILKDMARTVATFMSDGHKGTLLSSQLAKLTHDERRQMLQSGDLSQLSKALSRRDQRQEKQFADIVNNVMNSDSSDTSRLKN